MGFPVRATRSILSFLRCSLALGTALFLSFALLADTPGTFRAGSNAAACPCKCNEGMTHAGCSKMCDSPRRAKRWAANSCAKPPFKKPADNNGAGPRLPHPPRAERASL